MFVLGLAVGFVLGNVLWIAWVFYNVKPWG